MPIRNKCTPFVRPGQVPSFLAKSDLLAGRFVAVTADGVDTVTQLTGLGYPAAAAPIVEGVTMYDVPNGREVAVWHTGIVPVTAAAAITAGNYVGTDAQGRATVAASVAAAVGIAHSSAASGDAVRVRLFN